MDEIFRANALIALAIAAALAFFVGLAFGSKLPDVAKPPRLERAAEAFILALLDGMWRVYRSEGGSRGRCRRTGARLEHDGRRALVDPVLPCRGRRDVRPARGRLVSSS